MTTDPHAVAKRGALVRAEPGDVTWQALLHDGLVILRRARGWSQEDLATAAQLDRKTIRRMEQGTSRRRAPGRPTLRALARAFGCASLDALKAQLQGVLVEAPTADGMDASHEQSLSDAVDRWKAAHDAVLEHMVHSEVGEATWHQAMADELHGVTTLFAKLEERTTLTMGGNRNADGTNGHDDTTHTTGGST